MAKSRKVSERVDLQKFSKSNRYYREPRLDILRSRNGLGDIIEEKRSEEDPLGKLLEDEISFLKHYIYRWAQVSSNTLLVKGWNTWKKLLVIQREMEQRHRQETSRAVIKGIMISSEFNSRTPEEIVSLQEYFLAHKFVASDIPEQAFQRLCQKVEHLELNEHDLIFTQGSYAEDAYIIVEGKVQFWSVKTHEELKELQREIKLLKQMNQKLTGVNLKNYLGTMYMLRNSGVMGEVSLLMGAPRTMSAICAGPTRLLRIGKHVYNVSLRDFHLDMLKIREKMEFIMRLEFLKFWPDFHLLRLAYDLHAVEFPKGTQIMEQGYAFDYVYIIISGKVRLLRRFKVKQKKKKIDPALKRQHQYSTHEVFQIRRGGIIGHIECQKKRPTASLTAQCEGCVRAFRLPIQKFENYFYQLFSHTTRVMKRTCKLVQREIKQTIKMAKQGATNVEKTSAIAKKAGFERKGKSYKQDAFEKELSQLQLASHPPFGVHRTDSCLTFDSPSDNDSDPENVGVNFSEDISLASDDYWEVNSVRSEVSVRSIEAHRMGSSRSLPDLRRQGSGDSIQSDTSFPDADVGLLSNFTPRADIGHSNLNLMPVNSISKQKNRFDKQLAKKKKQVTGEAGVEGPLFEVSGLPPRPREFLSPSLPRIKQAALGAKDAVEEQSLDVMKLNSNRGPFASIPLDYAANPITKSIAKPREMNPNSLAPHSAAVISSNPLPPDFVVEQLSAI